ncbi:hypothetical protein Q1695_001252 [Nippostrongylus brasiliensis]|nr:hypothetical protein Q1695_001252 [Nippostrongylus brasiliensis]
MECATLCMLAASVNFVPSSDTYKCSYCVEARSTYSDCFDDIIECAYRDPSSLIFCLNIYEHAEASMVHYSARCLSYARFYVTDDVIKKVGSSGMCKFADVVPCECGVCPSKVTEASPTTTAVLKKHKHHHHHHHKPHHQSNGTERSAIVPKIYHNVSNHQQSANKKDGLTFAAQSKLATGYATILLSALSIVHFLTFY